MNRTLFQFDSKTLDTIHAKTTQILGQTGVLFPTRAALDQFKRHGFKVSGSTVFFREKQIAAALSGVHVGLHACGTMGSLLAMSFEKFLVDEDLCEALKKLVQPVEINEDTFAMDLIHELGHRADYLTQPHTVSRCRSAFFFPQMGICAPHAKWLEMAPRDIVARASERLRERLAAYRKPPIDQGLAQALDDYVLSPKTP